MAGPEKKGAVVSESKRRLVAYHEGGHALVCDLFSCGLHGFVLWCVFGS